MTDDRKIPIPNHLAVGSDLTPVNAARVGFNKRSEALEADDAQPA